MVLLMTVAAVCCVLQLGVLGSWGRSVRLTTLLLALGFGVYACGVVGVVLQIAWTRGLSAATGWSLHDIVAVAAYTVDPVIEEVVKVAPLVVLAWRWPRTHRQLGLTDHLLLGAALGVGFELFEAALRFSTLGALAMSVPGGYLVRANLAGSITVPSLWTSLTTWQPVPAAFQDLFAFGSSAGGDSVQHLVWTALAAVGVGWFVRRRDALRWLGAVGLVLACLDHMNYNLRTGSVPGWIEWLSDLVAWVGGLLPGLLVLLLVLVAAHDRLVQARVRGVERGVLLPGEAPTGLDPRPLLAVARTGVPVSTYVTWRFVLARRAALFAVDVGVGEPRLVDAVVDDAGRLDRARSAPAWAAVRAKVLRWPDPRALASWQSVLWLLAVVPALAYLVVGGFPATRGIQQAMRGTTGLWLLVAAGVAATILVGLQLRPLAVATRAVADPTIHEARGRLQLRLGTACAGLAAGAATVLVGVLQRDAGQHLVSNLHALDALGDALMILGIALFVASLFLYPPVGLMVIASTGELVLVSTVTSAFLTAAGASAALAGAGVMLNEASSSSGSSSGSGSGSAGDAAAARARRIDELAGDPAHGGKITDASRAEAEVGVGLEESGAVRGLRRSANEAEEFIDDAGRAWDVKAFHSERGRFNLDAAMRKISQEMNWSNENIMLDTRNLSSSDLSSLREAVEAATARGELPLRVLWWP
ncbi:hypothetical protein [Cellulomonas sp.]|uniref:hypothetical protein n=1 Tax=Cellulomonas sp. TaxID=40001 RepID=UPI003BA8FE22